MHFYCGRLFFSGSSLHYMITELHLQLIFNVKVVKCLFMTFYCAKVAKRFEEGRRVGGKLKCSEAWKHSIFSS